LEILKIISILSTGLDIRSLVQRAKKLSESGEYEGKMKASQDLEERLAIGLKQAKYRNMTKTGRGCNLKIYN